MSSQQCPNVGHAMACHVQHSTHNKEQATLDREHWDGRCRLGGRGLGTLHGLLGALPVRCCRGQQAGDGVERLALGTLLNAVGILLDQPADPSSPNTLRCAAHYSLQRAVHRTREYSQTIAALLHAAWRVVACIAADSALSVLAHEACGCTAKRASSAVRCGLAFWRRRYNGVEIDVLITYWSDGSQARTVACRAPASRLQ